MAQLKFEIRDQWIQRLDNFKPVARSINYLYAEFSFLSPEWTEHTPTAIFRNATEAYEVPLSPDNTCLVPHEVLEMDEGEMFVSVFCGDLVTANKSRVHIYESGYGDDLESSEPPTPSVYEQIIERMDDVEDAVEDAATRAENAATDAETAASHYPMINSGYWFVWDIHEDSYVSTGIKAEAEDGTSATVRIEPTDTGHRVIITDYDGEHAFDVPDGNDGRGIDTIELIGTQGFTDTYRMTFTTGEYFDYSITNGANCTIAVENISGGHRLIITDQNGTRTVDVMNGARGADGFSPTVNITNIPGGYNVAFTDHTGTKAYNVYDGARGADGVSPSVDVTAIPNGHRVTITDKQGIDAFDVLDGEDYNLTEQDKEDIAALVDMGASFHICSSSEYDATTRVPTIQNPEENVFYLVPAESGSSPDLFVEWIYVNNAWEMFGSATIDLSNYVSKESIENAGITQKTYTVIVDDSITTETDATHDVPYVYYGNSNINNEYKYRVTFDGVVGEYNARLFRTYYPQRGTKGVEYIGDLSLYNPSEYSGALYPIDQVPFCIVHQTNEYDGLQIYTETSGSHTIKIERINYTLKTIPTSLIYGNEVAPIVKKESPSGYFGVSIGQSNSLENERSSVAIGGGNTISGQSGVAIGISNLVSGDFGVAVGRSLVTSGQNSYCEGYNSTASGNTSHAEGEETTAGGEDSHSEGYRSVASGLASHAEGIGSTASGSNSHAEGGSTTASGSQSHAAGLQTIANHRSQNVFGRFNVADPSNKASTSYGNYVEIVGNGTADNARSNARTLDWDGNEVLAGKLTLGATPTNNMDAATKEYVDQKADIIISNASSAVASFSDGVEYDAVGLVAEFAPVQSGSGDPSPSNVRPITGWTGLDVSATGKNLLNPLFIKHAAYDTNGNILDFPAYISYSLDLPSGTYTFSTDMSSNYFTRYLIDNITNELSLTAQSVTFTLSKYSNVKISMRKTTSEDISGETPNAMIEVGSVATPYEPYNGTITPVSWQTEAGTVYGGYVDAVRGKLIATWGFIDLATLSWEIVSNRIRTQNLMGTILPPDSQTVLPDIVCEKYDRANYGAVLDSRPNTIAVLGNGTLIMLYTNGDPTPSGNMAYKLIEPIEYDIELTTIPLLLGYNNVWTSAGGNVDVQYKADTKLYLEAHTPEVKVDDVQVNGTSVVNNSVANVPLAGTNTHGVVRVSGFGLDMSNGVIIISSASAANVKAGATNYYPVSPYHQHESTFWGLAKAAGVDMASSSNIVGTYTDEAKIAIQKMLGIYEPPWELLNDITLQEESGIDLTADSNGTPYNLIGVFIYVFYPANLETASAGYARYRFYDSDDNYCNSETGKYTTATNQKYKYISLERRNNLSILSYTIQQPTGNGTPWYIKTAGTSETIDLLNGNGGVSLSLDNVVRIALASGDVEPAGTRIRIYGQRAY